MHFRRYDDLKTALYGVDASDAVDATAYAYAKIKKPVTNVPNKEDLLKVLKTERECVSRDCDRNCGKCDLSLEQGEILSVYDALIAMLGDADGATP